MQTKEMLADIMTKLKSDSRKETLTSDVKAKYGSISEAFESFDWSQIHGGKIHHCF